MTHETWNQMTRRHHAEREEMEATIAACRATVAKRFKAERVQLVETLAAERLTQTQAACRLDVSLTALNNFIRRRGIFWPVIQQGKRQ